MNEELTERIIGGAIEVHRILGPGLLEAIYEEAFCHELTLRRITHQRQVPVDVVYKGYTIKGQRIDLLIENAVVVELKSLQRLPEVVLAQALSYLKETGLRTALIINFGEKKLVDGVKRVSL